MLPVYGFGANGDPNLMRTGRNCLMLLGFMVTTGVCVSAQTTKPYEPQCDLSQIDKMMGAVSLSLGIERVVTPTMDCFLSLWRNDKGGSTKFYVSNGFLSIMEQNPRAFFSSFSKDPEVFQQWLGDVENLSFTWPFDPPCKLEETRKHMIAILEHSVVEPGKPSEFKKGVQTKLSALRCRQIN